MWCRECAQDVPAIPEKGAGYACARCGHAIERPRFDAVSAASHEAQADSELPESAEADRPMSPSHREEFASSVDRALDDLNGASRDEPQPWPRFSAGPPPQTLLDWQLEDTLRDVQAALRQRKTAPRRPLRLDSKERSKAEWHVHAAHRPVPWPKHTVVEPRPKHTVVEPARAVEATRSTPWLAWLLLWPGMTLLVCGSVLLGCAVWQGRDELWRLGVPIAAVGQTAVFFGVAMLVERAWNHRAAATAPGLPIDPSHHDRADRPRANPSRGRRRTASRRDSSRRSTPRGASSRATRRQLKDLQSRLDDLADQL